MGCDRMTQGMIELACARPPPVLLVSRFSRGNSADISGTVMHVASGHDGAKLKYLFSTHSLK